MFFLSITDGFMRASVEVKRPVRKVTISLGERWLSFCLCAYVLAYIGKGN